MEAPPSPLSSRPKRTRISYHAELAASTYAPFRRERRMRIANANKFDRKSGGAQRRDLCVDASSWKCFSTERTRISCHTALETTAFAAFSKEGRMNCANATNSNRKSGVA
jgi:hypothetical protein